MLYRSLVLRKLQLPRSRAGFSMVELIVSISILIMVLSIVLSQQGAFNSAVLLRSQAYDIALALREVQLSAVSATNDGVGNFRSIEGMYFQSGATVTSIPKFIDASTPANYFYDGVSEDFGFPVLLDTPFEIRGFEPSSIGRDLAIVFERPNFDARFYSAANTPISEPSVTIVVAFKKNPGTVCGEDYREIEVTSAGQIAVLECP